MADIYGRDLYGVEDLSYALHEVQDQRLGVAQAIGRRLQSLLYYDDDYGYDMRQLLSAAMLPELTGQIEHRVEEEALKDERVARARATVNRSDNGETIDVRLQVALYAQGPFVLTLTVDQLSVKVLSIE